MSCLEPETKEVSPNGLPQSLSNHDEDLNGSQLSSRFCFPTRKISGPNLSPYLQRYVRFHCQALASLRTGWRRLCSPFMNFNCRRTFRFPIQFLHVARQCSCGDSQAVLLKKMDQHLERVSPFPQQTQLREYLPYNPAHPVQSRLRCRFVRLFLQKRTKLIDIERREYLRSTTGLILHIPTLYHIDRLYISSIIDC